MKIIPFTIDKYEEVKTILVEAGSFDNVWDDFTHWSNKIKKEPNSILLATEKDEVVGCILIINEPWTSFLFRLSVKNGFRERGIGSELIKVAEKQLKDSGADEVAIFVKIDNEELHNFYEKRGYEKGGEYRCMYKKL